MQYYLQPYSADTKEDDLKKPPEKEPPWWLKLPFAAILSLGWLLTGTKPW